MLNQNVDLILNQAKVQAQHEAAIAYGKDLQSMENKGHTFLQIA
jgi:hypothetical protein